MSSDLRDTLDSDVIAPALQNDEKNAEEIKQTSYICVPSLRRQCVFEIFDNQNGSVLGVGKTSTLFSDLVPSSQSVKSAANQYSRDLCRSQPSLVRLRILLISTWLVHNQDADVSTKEGGEVYFQDNNTFNKGL